ncbi:mechanosensitive ion channel [Chelativorans sp. ZYF759]|uniref:mechanosensitive ion channel family protein n=1 Tax=Chelativorans sp. ZYF759 TaxID=2692213 RepID=UPI00145E2E12|nr:mechanosensitive ion channel family protein [Chelativorans sp. ZYF759]NMG39080.1 mechanosensitive ion channel [Chelativorans sp. ZYF759]
MENITARTTTLWGAVEMALIQLAQLAVAYSFSVLGAIVLLVAGYLVAGVAERSAYAAMGRISGFDETLKRFFSKAVRYAVLVFVGVTVLAQFGVQTASIIAALGAAGLAIGLALQGTLQNIAAGIMILVLRPFRVGEFITAGSVSGGVQEVGLFATELKTFDGIYVLVPNSQLWNTAVTNFSRNPTRSTDISTGIGYGDDLDLALKVVRELVSADARVLADPPPSVFVAELGDSSVVITARYWTTGGDWFATKLHFRKAIKAALEENGISIPFPQREVRVIGGGAGPVGTTDGAA